MMKRTSIKSVLLLAVVVLGPLVSDVAHAVEGHGAHDVTIDTLLWPTINFLIYFGLMVFFFKRFAVPVLKNYRTELESTSVRETSEHAALEREIEDLKARLEVVGEEKKAIMSEMDADGVAIAADIVAAAHKKAADLQATMLKRVSAEQAKIAADAKLYMLEEAMDRAKAQLAERTNGADDFRSMISHLEGGIGRIFTKA